MAPDNDIKTIWNIGVSISCKLVEIATLAVCCYAKGLTIVKHLYEGNEINYREAVLPQGRICINKSIYFWDIMKCLGVPTLGVAFMRGMFHCRLI